MEFVTQKDLDQITSCAGKEVNDIDFDVLKHIYEKLDHICEKLRTKGYECNIRKDPRRQAGQGMFKFQDYQWAKVYPPEFKKYCNDKFSYIVGFSDSLHFHMMGIKDFQNKQASLDASKISWTEIDIASANYDSVVNDFMAFDNRFRELFIDTAIRLGITELTEFKNNIEMDKIEAILNLKKQIILQGPPGTGKTRMAKQLAARVCSIAALSIVDIKKFIVPNMEIRSAKNIASYKIVQIETLGIKIQNETGNVSLSTFYDIIEAYKHRSWETGTIQNGAQSVAVGIARYIFQQQDNLFQKKDHEQVKLIQFHPSYSYEDFVRGITARSNGGAIEYETKNKILASFAKKAYENYKNSNRPPQDVNKENYLAEQFELFAASIGEQIANKGFPLTEAVSIFSRDDDGAFRYTGHKWAATAKYRMTLADILNVYLSNATSNPQVMQLTNISKTAKQRPTYYLIMANHFRDFMRDKQIPADSSVTNELKHYVLIIDEINRANLPAVLGELIYALEYRNEPVETMYDIDDDKFIVLPPNLYIIGTMNTADRSVGHIDYAIRRRFAFVDVLPSKEPVHALAQGLFKQVSGLFVKNFDTIDWSKPKPEPSECLASDFRPEDIWIGHSYFISTKADEHEVKEELRLKLEYEIRPLLKEYLKDGILVSLKNEAGQDMTKHKIDNLKLD